MLPTLAGICLTGTCFTGLAKQMTNIGSVCIYASVSRLECGQIRKYLSLLECEMGRLVDWDSAEIDSEERGRACILRARSSTLPGLVVVRVTCLFF